MAIIKDRYQLEIETRGATAGLTRLKGALPIAGFAAAGAAAAAFGKQLLDSQQVIEGYRNQLRLITDGQEDLDATFATLAQSARKTRTELGSTIELFQKLTIATEEMRVSEEDVLTVTEQLSKALAVAGADAATTSSVVRQFGQAMASGTVRGDEFNSLVEGLGPALAIMARESGITVGELREMSQAGELTAQVMFDMLKNSNSLNESFAKLAPTTEQLTNQLAESWTYATAQLGEYLGVQNSVNNGLLFLTRTLDDLSDNPAAPLIDVSAIDIIEGVKDGVIDAEAAITELQQRIQLATTNGGLLREALDFSGSNEGYEELNAALIELEAYLSAVEVAAQREAGAFGDVAQAMTEAGAAIQKVNREQEVFAQSLGMSVDEAQEFTKFIEELNAKITENIDKDQQVAAAIDHFNSMLEAGVISAERHAEAMKLLGETTEEVKQVFQDSPFEEFFKGLVESSREAVTEQTNAMMAFELLDEQLRNGKISIDVYADAVAQLNGILGRTGAEATESGNQLETYAEFVERTNQAINKSLRNDSNKSRMLVELKQQYDEGALSISFYREALKRLDDSYVEVLDSESRYREFAQKTHTAVRESIDTDVFKGRMLRELKEQLDNNILTLDEYNRYLEELNGTTKETVDQHAKLKEAIEKTNQSTQDRIKAAQDESMLDNLRGIERELKSIELQEQRTAAAAKRRIQEQFAGKLSNAELTAALSEIDAATTRSIELQQDLAMETYKNQRSFATGWKDAFEEYREAATDNSKLAADVFNRFTRGMEDSIVEFARTGKFSMKDFLADIAEMILRSQVQRLIAQIFGGSSLFGGSSNSNFAGGFANGGTIPAGQFGLTGENGPEFVSGPATITPMGGSNMVTYNINAVDAPSFQSLVARDPGFIHAVSEQGRRAIPAGRR